MTDFAGLLRTLVQANVEFVIIGGVAATIHGSARLTRDVDVVYRRGEANDRRLVEALSHENSASQEGVSLPGARPQPVRPVR